MRTCGFAPAGTWGHECGRPAVVVAVFKTDDLNPTESGFFYVGRCADCSKIKHGENAGILRLEPEAGKVNKWKNNQWNYSQGEKQV